MNSAPSIQAAVSPIARHDVSEESLLHQEEGADTPVLMLRVAFLPLISPRIWKRISVFFSIIFIAALTMTLILLFVVNLPFTSALVLVALNATVLSALALSITLCLGCINCEQPKLSKNIVDFMEKHEQKNQ